MNNGSGSRQSEEYTMDRRTFLHFGSSACLAGMTPFLNTGLSQENHNQIIEPQASDALIANPGMGFETFHCFNTDDRITRLPYYPKCSIAYFRFYWDALEPKEGKYNFDMMDQLVDKAQKNGQELALRFMPMSTTNAKQGTPKWYTDKAKVYSFKRDNSTGWAPDHNDPYFLSKQEALISAFGEKYNGSPYICRMDIGSVGFWGEWHLSHTEPPVPMITEENAIRIIDMYLKYWNQIPLSMLIGYVPGLRYAVENGTGWRADSLGDYGHFSDTWCHMTDAYPQKLAEANASQAWKRGPIAYEPPGSMTDLEKYVPSKGGGYDKMWDQALQWGGSAYNPKSGTIPAAQIPAIERFLKRCGYRFVLKRVAIPQTWQRKEKNLPISIQIENVGVAPAYKNYRLAIKLTGLGAPVILPSKSKVSQWLPGEHHIEERCALPDSLPAGTYNISLGILHPSLARPAIQLANTGGDEDGWYPLSHIKII
jgi:hypothetical protein